MSLAEDRQKPRNLDVRDTHRQPSLSSSKDSSSRGYERLHPRPDTRPSSVRNGQSHRDTGIGRDSRRHSNGDHIHGSRFPASPVDSVRAERKRASDQRDSESRSHKRVKRRSSPSAVDSRPRHGICSPSPKLRASRPEERPSNGKLKKHKKSKKHKKDKKKKKKHKRQEDRSQSRDRSSSRSRTASPSRSAERRSPSAARRSDSRSPVHRSRSRRPHSPSPQRRRHSESAGRRSPSNGSSHRHRSFSERDRRRSVSSPPPRPRSASESNQPVSASTYSLPSDSNQPVSASAFRTQRTLGPARRPSVQSENGRHVSQQHPAHSRDQHPDRVRRLSDRRNRADCVSTQDNWKVTPLGSHDHRRSGKYRIPYKIAQPTSRRSMSDKENPAAPQEQASADQQLSESTPKHVTPNNDEQKCSTERVATGPAPENRDTVEKQSRPSNGDASSSAVADSHNHGHKADAVTNGSTKQAADAKAAANAAEPESADDDADDEDNDLRDRTRRDEASGGAVHTSTLDAEAHAAIPGVCVECEELPSLFECVQCQDEYCELCFKALHRRGKRAQHESKKKSNPLSLEEARVAAGLTGHKTASSGAEKEMSPLELAMLERNSPQWFVERAKYIPVRLHMKQRRTLRFMHAALGVSDYTARVDADDLKPGKRRKKQITELCSFMTGLAIGQKFDLGVKLIESRNFAKYEEFYRTVFEYVRRYKIMNPEKMRSIYGKLVYMLQDACQEHVTSVLGFNCVEDVETVYSHLKDASALGVLTDANLATATMEILPDGKSRHQIQSEIKAKERAQDMIARRYCNNNIDRDGIKWCLYSMSDNNSFLRVNRDPIDMMITHLKTFFSPDTVKHGMSLAINAGVDDARLSHSHEKQYNYVLQSLTLWREIMDDMFRLWYLCEQDLLNSTNGYHLKDTGQGRNRVQAGPRVFAAMRVILHKTQQELGQSWVGSSVIHLGDDNVPNALMFIDKYMQVPRILGPVAHTIKAIPRLCKDDTSVKGYIDSTFGGQVKLARLICHDFFLHAFDGSGADNFFDAGSCIDGRLTSAWNWCNKLPSKPFYSIFQLAGFTNFDGEFQD